jgi:hypothetical protein
MQKSYENKNSNGSNRIRALSLGLATIALVGMTEVGHRSVQYVQENLKQHGSEILAHALMERENEPTRVPMRIRDGMHPQTVSGSST